MAKLATKQEPSKQDPTKDSPTAPEAKKDVVKYKALRLKRLIKNNGFVVLPDAEGNFIPADQEESNQLKYFAAQNMSYVEAL
jgi:hypothetical protein